jgi:hypothetical protein
MMKSQIAKRLEVKEKMWNEIGKMERRERSMKIGEKMVKKRLWRMIVNERESQMEGIRLIH